MRLTTVVDLDLHVRVIFADDISQNIRLGLGEVFTIEERDPFYLVHIRLLKQLIDCAFDRRCGRNQLTVIKCDNFTLFHLDAIDLNRPSRYGDITRVYFLDRFLHGLFVFLEAAFRVEPEHGGKSLGSIAGWNDDNMFDTDFGSVLGSQNDVFIIWQDYYFIGREILKSSYKFLDAGVHGLSAFNNRGDTQTCKNGR